MYSGTKKSLDGISLLIMGSPLSSIYGELRTWLPQPSECLLRWWLVKGLVQKHVVHREGNNLSALGRGSSSE